MQVQKQDKTGCIMNSIPLIERKFRTFLCNKRCLISNPNCCSLKNFSKQQNGATRQSTKLILVRRSFEMSTVDKYFSSDPKWPWVSLVKSKMRRKAELFSKLEKCFRCFGVQQVFVRSAAPFT